MHSHKAMFAPRPVLRPEDERVYEFCPPSKVPTMPSLSSSNPNPKPPLYFRKSLLIPPSPHPLRTGRGDTDSFPHKLSLLVTAYDLDLDESLWYTFDITSPSVELKKHSNSHLHRPYLHVIRNCDQGFLPPIAVAPQYEAADPCCALLDSYDHQGNPLRRLYRLASSINDLRVEKSFNEDVCAIDIDVGLGKAKGTWYSRASLSVKRFRPHTYTLDGKIYALGGGVDPSISKPWGEVYDPNLDKWTPLPDPNRLRDRDAPQLQTYDMFTATSTDPVSGHKVIFVGFRKLGELYMLDVSQNKWTSLGQDHQFMESRCGSKTTAAGFVLLWFSRDLIMYAYDIPTRRLVHTRRPFYSLISPEGPTPPSRDIGAAPSLLHIGGNLFCCSYITPVWNRFVLLDPVNGSLHRENQNQLHCVNFRATFAISKQYLNISVESCQSYTVQAQQYISAALVNRELEWRNTLLPGCLNETFENNPQEQYHLSEQEDTQVVLWMTDDGVRILGVDMEKRRKEFLRIRAMQNKGLFCSEGRLQCEKISPRSNIKNETLENIPQEQCYLSNGDKQVVAWMTVDEARKVDAELKKRRKEFLRTGAIAMQNRRLFCREGKTTA